MPPIPLPIMTPARSRSIPSRSIAEELIASSEHTSAKVEKGSSFRISLASKTSSGLKFLSSPAIETRWLEASK